MGYRGNYPTGSPIEASQLVDGIISYAKLATDARMPVLMSLITVTSGTSHDFNSVPTGVKVVVVNFSGVSTNGTSNIIVQIGDSGGIENSGYIGSTTNIAGAAVSATTNWSSGFMVGVGGSAAAIYSGSLVLSLLDSASNSWSGISTLSRSDTNQVHPGSGSKQLTATLDRLRLTTVGGTDTFDAGTINVSYFR